MRENLSTRKCQMGLDARKFSCAKISTFTVFLVKYLYMPSLRSNRRREWKPSIVSSRLATLLRFSRGNLRWSVMVCDASRTPKWQENDPFHCNVWQDLNIIKIVGFIFFYSCNTLHCVFCKEIYGVCACMIGNLPLLS